MDRPVLRKARGTYIFGVFGNVYIRKDFQQVSPNQLPPKDLMSCSRFRKSSPLKQKGSLCFLSDPPMGIKLNLPRSDPSVRLCRRRRRRSLPLSPSFGRRRRRRQGGGGGLNGRGLTARRGRKEGKEESRFNDVGDAPKIPRRRTSSP